MKRYNTRAFVAALAALAIAGLPMSARADIKDYEFQLVDGAVPVSPDATVAVRLVNKATGQAVPDAVIFVTRFDMAPDGMGAMISPMTAMPSAEPGVYKFKTNVSMAGRWQFSLAAKVQGENGTVESKLIVKAQP
jgi:hypothetical protein